MNISAVTNAILVLALVAWVLHRQTIARPVTARSLWLLPGILAVIGVAGIGGVDNGKLSATAVTYLAIDLGSSAALGAIRGCFVRVFERDGVMWRQGSVVTVALWVVAIGVRVVVAILASNAGVGNVSDAALELAFGVSLLAQNGVVVVRGSRRGYRFAPDPRGGPSGGYAPGPADPAAGAGCPRSVQLAGLALD
jgi:hypothetical protein